MRNRELRDSAEARRFLLQGLWLQRAMPPKAQGVTAALGWAFELAGGGEPLPPPGFIADVGHLAFDAELYARGSAEVIPVPGLDPGLIRTYEDHVLGKLYGDWSFERGSAAVCRYQGRDRARGLAFLLAHFRHRAGYPGVELAPSVIKSLMERPGAEVLADGWTSITQDGLMPLLTDLYQSLIAHVRNAADALGAEDVFELEHGTALAQFAQRVALRQVLQTAAALEAPLPRQRLRPLSRRREVPTRVLEEDAYPVGGFSSISTRGTIESLLHSQLAYMEREGRPDLFDIKYLRDELLYYSRDENQFLRQRRTFVFVLYPDLTQARYKDPGLPVQRAILVLATILVLERKLTEWLSSDALVFQCLFVHAGEGDPLAAERTVVETLFRDQIANGTVVVDRLPPGKLPARFAELARRSKCQGLLCSTAERTVRADEVPLARLRVNAARPDLRLDGTPAPATEPESDLAAWAGVVETLLRLWI